MGLIEDNFQQYSEYVERNPILFGDFRCAMDEAEPRLYEDVQDYEATKALFLEVLRTELSFCIVFVYYVYF